MGVVLTMTMVVITGLAITRERERGTMENLLSMPTRPLEVMIGKIVPYILVGYIQVGLILTAARLLFHVPMVGSIGLLLVVALVFIAANLAMGITFSTVAQNQLQAMQMSFFFFLPSLLLSGFMFPFAACPNGPRSSGRFPADSFSPDRPRHSAEGQRCGGRRAATVADRAVYRRRPRHRGEALPPNTGLRRASVLRGFSEEVLQQLVGNELMSSPGL